MKYKQINEFTLLMVREKTTSKRAAKVFSKSVTAPGDIINAVAPLYDGMDREKFIVGALNTRHKIIGYNVVSIIFLFHNHPSGDLEPSSEDINLTKRLVEAGELLGIPVLDHVIIGHNGNYTSMKSRNLI